ncbi:GtrA family protein [Actinomadura madurae]|uniref:GtrA family protein n=1 Tax=Actinomadura madurae TaxID=1993 RepID=UPI002025E0A8|nr:GtrA family protein [Actinomadura madurae]URN06434.1 GtrA family protein [Actinomadura madurae]
MGLLTHSAIRYLIIGGLSFAVDFGVLFVAHGMLDVRLPVATTAAFLTSFAVNFGLNRVWSFGSRSPVGRQLVRYVSLVVVNTVVTVLLVSGLAAVGVQYLVAKTIVTAGLVALNYVAYRVWVFR